ncbi:hypothetical protein [Sinorhizobium meliloti]|uniref:hypothetical protein n=1 Tax=Rhizobium meliloti TaxID=382 RepID=UPI001296E067|nr:hypothetical protein [Sinorhizobium meliloti]MQX28880.1 hypothetical protein [Sinorhizobium meliloti]
MELLNPNKGWVVAELDKFLAEWRDWLRFVSELPDSPDYNPQTCTDAIKDGWENIRKHDVLREKTLTFLATNFGGYDFLFLNWPRPPHENNMVRKAVVVPGWIHRLETLTACIDYARVPDGFWKEQGKKMVEQLALVAPEKAADTAASWLRNPFAK